MPQTVLVTGAAGFIGRHLVGALLRRGFNVRAADRSPAKSSLAPGPGLEVHAADVSDADACARLCEGVDAVLHFAAMASVPEGIRRPDDCRRDTLLTTERLAQAAQTAGARRFVFASTAAVYGNAPSPVPETAPRTPLNPYAQAKADAEDVVRACTVDGVSLRFFNVYGPGQPADSPYAGVITRFVDRVRRGETIELHGDGNQTRDFLYVDDAVRTALLALDASELGGEAINIGTGHPVSLNQLLNLLRWLLRAEPNVRHLPEREGDIRDSCADVALAKQRLGFKASVTLEDGLRRLVQVPSD